MPPLAIDPFALWPDSRSAIAGLRSGEPHRASNYAFHTAYLNLGARRATFRVCLDGLTAQAGRLRIRLQSTRDGKPAKLVEERKVDLKRFAGDIDLLFHVEAEFGSSYAIRGVVDRGRTVVARSVDVTLDEITGPEAYYGAMRRARRERLARPSKMRTGRWPRRQTVETLGLVQRTPATIASPVSQMCTAAQFDELDYLRWIETMHWPQTRHRKQWEFVYILAVLERHGMLAPGRRGLGFGTGMEPLPALMASRGCSVVATDLPVSDQATIGWAATNQHAQDREALWMPHLVDHDTFDRNVAFRAVDMNAIPDDLAGFDFCWSACAYEHVGSIAAGLRFVERSIGTLRPGGVAVHTTELNLLSDDETIDNQATVLFRQQDFERLALRLTEQGHRVLPLCWDQGNGPIDEHIDLPPYAGDVHLKLALAHFVTTSFGMIVVRGG